MRKLFGTDGMRGVAGVAPLDPATLYRLGYALVGLLRDRAPGLPMRIAIGEDTRESCRWIRSALARGFTDAGGEAIAAGVMPTPALALITREGQFAAGLMISASHNPFEDNGVKVFNRLGAKLSDESELRIERAIDGAPLPAGDLTAHDEAHDEHEALQEQYLAFLERCLEGVRFDGLTVVLDTANGAAHRLAPEAFRRAGARVITLGDDPNGRNINLDCGSLHPERMVAAVREHGADVGFAFDGDADRCIGATRDGRLLDGDFALYYAGRALQRAGRLPGATVVATVMSNLGLEKALEAEGVRMLRAPVGDRYVLAAMQEGGFTVGGEQSGHVILLDHAPTGDGTLTALTLVKLWRQGHGELEDALAAIPHYPQRLKNVRVRQKPRIEDHPVIAEAVQRAEREMGGNGRVVVRYSGTEPLARVMIEGPDQALVDRLVDDLIGVFQREVGLTPVS